MDAGERVRQGKVWFVGKGVKAGGGRGLCQCTVGGRKDDYLYKRK